MFCRLQRALSQRTSRLLQALVETALWAVADRPRHSVRADLLKPRLRAGDTPPYQQPTSGISCKKSAREVFAGAHSFYLETTLSLRSRRRSGSRFFVSNYRGRLSCQYYFAHDDPVTHC